MFGFLDTPIARLASHRIEKFKAYGTRLLLGDYDTADICRFVYINVAALFIF